MFPGWQQLLIVLILVLILFGGRGRISSLMGDLAKGIRSFRSGLAEEEEKPAQSLEAGDDEPVDAAQKDKAETK